MSSEAKIQTKAIRYARSKGVLVKRNYLAPGAEVAWPDVEFFFHGARTLFIEFKAPGKRTRANQTHRINQLRARGFSAYVCDNYEDAKVLIDRYLGEFE